jgi:hypothetical protein
MIRCRSLVLALLVGAVFAGPALAQDVPAPPMQSVVGSAAMESVLLDHAASVETAREELRTLLQSDEVREVAEERGISMNRVTAAAERMSDAQVQAASPLVERAMEAIQQGSRTITISVYTIIIILLLLILLT